ncbi:hypothetical protein ETH_00034235 [Eimeria tenella]|uniref:Uncharacterized protein n=1 Tax=Eimeria tenella TaxID=5802 RepID=U6L6W9_EIMTE|nr:hypothetical protein ETH_00034235 [Eimeria tenella]CDJ44339.1 hypothetical protein ETH_00034235 [Eimeria tenella]|eukprot:XP_013235088.1 hypothetical protein ETH_00034235 [Eimeria tenella]
MESELDDANRVRKRLEKAQAVSLSQLQLLQQLQQQQEKEGDKEQQQQQQLNELIKKNAELQDAVRELTESKDQLTKQMMEAFSKSDTRAADAAEDLKVRLAAAEAQAAALQQQQLLQVDLLKAQFEKETEGALNALKEQLQIRDRESSFYRKAMIG